jgi:hypothetical protein
MLRKNHPLFNEINRVIRDDAVHFMSIYNKYIVNAKPSKCDQNVYGPKSLGLTPFYITLLMFLIGLVFGIVSFFVELLSKFNCQ